MWLASRIENIATLFWKKISEKGPAQKGFLIFMILLMVGIGFNTVLRASRSHGSQYDDFTGFSQDLLYDGINIYEAYSFERTTIAKYPPFFGVVFAPLVPLPLWLGGTIWFLLGVVLVVLASQAVARMAWTFTRGKGDGPPLVAWVAPLLMTIVVIITNLSTSQVNIFIFSLVILGLGHFTRRNDHWAGILIGVAAAIKLTPGLFVVYFAYKGSWKTVLWAAVGGFVCWGVILPLIMGPDYYMEIMLSWINKLTGFVTEGTMAEGVAGYRHTNQSLEAAFYRFFTHTPANGGFDNFYLNLVSIPYTTASIILKVIKLGILAGLAFICRTPLSDRKDLRLLYEFSLVMIATLYLSPISWINHYVVMILPFGATLYYLMTTQKTDPARNKMVIAMAVGVLLLSLTHPVFLAFSLPFFGSLWLAFSLAKQIRRPVIIEG